MNSNRFAKQNTTILHYALCILHLINDEGVYYYGKNYCEGFT